MSKMSEEWIRIPNGELVDISDFNRIRINPNVLGDEFHVLASKDTMGYGGNERSSIQLFEGTKWACKRFMLVLRNIKNIIDIDYKEKDDVFSYKQGNGHRQIAFGNISESEYHE